MSPRSRVAAAEDAERPDECGLRQAAGAKDGLFKRAGSLASMARVPPTHHRVFVDPEDMKAKVRQNLIKPTYSVFDLYHRQGLWQKIARHPLFENITLGVIGLNAIWIAVDTDRNEAETLLVADPVFQIVEHLFCVYFSFEWFVRFMSFRRKLDGAKDGWFIFDSALVLMMVFENWVMTSVMVMTGGGSSSGIGGTSILRLFRLLRLSRMARMLRSMPELMILIKGMVSAMRSVFFVMCLLVIIIYIFAIAFTQLAVDNYIGEVYFSSVGASMYSLLLYGTFLDNLSVVCGAIKQDSMLCLVLFFVFVLLSALTVMNMLIGVLCEVVSAVAETEKEEMAVNFVTTKLRGILEDLDENKDSVISRKEFMHILENPEAVLALDEVGVDPVGVVDCADFIFDDTADEAGLHFSEFMEVVLKLRGSNTATVKDIVDLRKFVFAAIEQVRHGLTRGPGAQAMQLRLRTSSKKQQNGGGAAPAPVERTHTGPGDAVSPMPSLREAAAPEAAAPEAAPDANHEVVQRLQQRVQRMEEALVCLLGEIRKLSERLPPPNGARPLQLQEAAGPAEGRALPHLLHVEEATTPLISEKRDTMFVIDGDNHPFIAEGMDAFAGRELRSSPIRNGELRPCTAESLR